MATRLVSAVIPVYNGERFLADAIGSVLGQTHRDIECIVVDDGSTDGTADVARSFGPDVVLVRKANGGPASAANAGVAAATGSLIAFLDSDDVWLPEKLARQVDCFDAEPNTVLAFCGYAVVPGRSERPRYRIYATEPRARIRSALMMEAYGIAFSSTAMISREAATSVGPLDERLSVGADIAYAWRLAQRGEVVAIPDALALYRLHGHAQMHNNLDAIEHDAEIFMPDVFRGEDATLRRARANLHTHLTFRHLLRGHLRRAAKHARCVMAQDPDRLLALPLTALWRRVARRVSGHWPLATPARPASAPALPL